MREVILVRFGEIFLKGKNYGFFEKTLFNNIKRKLDGITLNINKTSGRIIISDFDEVDKMEIIDRVKNVFGTVNLSVAYEIDTNIDKIKEICANITIPTNTFKVETKRADKSFPMTSTEFSAMIGGVVLKNNTGLKVDVHNPQTTLNIDIRESKKTYIYYEKIPCVGGMPTGTAGRVMLLLSGGIDSPVAGYQIAKRGVTLSAIHFHSYPYTSEQAKQKVIDLAKLLKKYVGNINLFVVPFTKIQEEIHKNCDDEYMVTIVRRFMMKISERVAIKNGCMALITGESLGQVASQTLESIFITNDAGKNIPIFRPLIAMDKIDIMKISQEIGTYETSILPYEDCCSVFLPDSPVTKPKMTKIEENEKILDVETLINEAIENIELIKIN